METHVRPRIVEKNKQPGVCYAFTDDGIELPVVDITHPAFFIDPSPAELAAIAASTLARLKRSARMPRFLLRLLARKSILARGSMSAHGTFVSGLTTYLLKLGPDNLGRGYAGPIDRRMAASLSPVCLRIRLRDVARLLAEGLRPALAARQGPLHLLNVGGGTAVDSLNALILLRRESPALMAGRRVLVQVFDIDGAGPAFGARALEALVRVGCPLEGLDARLEHVVHNWNDIDGLRRLVGRVDPQAVVGVSSEGGLFEYGSDEVIVATLAVLRDSAPADCAVVGSLMKDEPAARTIKELSQVVVRLLAPDALGALVGRAGWTVAGTGAAQPLYGVIRLARLD